MELIKAGPPAAPIPVRKRVGIVQKIARAEVTPISAAVAPIIARMKEPEATKRTIPNTERRQAMVRLLIFLPLRSTCQAQMIIATEAKRQGRAARRLTVRLGNPYSLRI